MNNEQPQSRRSKAAKDAEGGASTSSTPASGEEAATVGLAVDEGAGAPADAPTQPRPIDANGYELDAEGLPMVGPARARALAARTAGSQQLDGALGTSERGEG
jgi:hypothetical protein